MLGSLEHGEGEQEDGHGAEGKLSHDQLLTDPDQAVDFVEKTGVDALAIAMGTSHGAYKFSRKPDGEILAMNVIEEIHRRLPNTHLVMHGSSSVPQDLQDIINQYGGKMKPTWGVPVEEIQRGIKHGVRKINIDTDNRMAMTGQIRKVLTENPAEFDPRKYLKPAMEAMTKLCKQRLEEFGTAGQASKIKVLSTSAMAKRYASGELDPNFGATRRGGGVARPAFCRNASGERGLARRPRFRYGMTPMQTTPIVPMAEPGRAPDPDHPRPRRTRPLRAASLGGLRGRRRRGRDRAPCGRGRAQPRQRRQGPGAGRPGRTARR